MKREPNILKRVIDGELRLPPVEFEVVSLEPSIGGSVRADLLIDARWEDERLRFATEVGSLSTPKALSQLVALAREAAVMFKASPMVVVPYLSEDKLRKLECAGVSGVDLCGNGVINVPGRMLVFRSGQPNRFPQSAKLKNVYRGKNSLVARAFLLQPTFKQVKDIVAFLEQRDGAVAPSTVSKVLKRLDEELIVNREGNSIRLLQADSLLDNLAANYEPIQITDRLRAKCAVPITDTIRQLTSLAASKGEKLILTGASSGDRYAVMAREPITSIYTTMSISDILTILGTTVSEADRFANLEIFQTPDARAFFDPRIERDIPYASPIQTYLELTAGDKHQNGEQVNGDTQC